MYQIEAFYSEKNFCKKLLHIFCRVTFGHTNTCWQWIYSSFVHTEMFSCQRLLMLEFSCLIMYSIKSNKKYILPYIFITHQIIIPLRCTMDKQKQINKLYHFLIIFRTYNQPTHLHTLHINSINLSSNSCTVQLIVIYTKVGVKEALGHWGLNIQKGESHVLDRMNWIDVWGR